MKDGTGQQAAQRAAKSQTAFRTISEVADELGVAQHVLRFWESRFPQVRPLKRGGGRRYYRPEDVEVLRQIRALLYDEGYTIKGAQKHLRARKIRPGAGEEPVGPTPRVTVHPSPATRGLAGDSRRRLTGLREELVELRDLLDQVR
ncbi:MerR family transcriptional regulator [Geminicoccaceae bacterium 1502E]|nr:MerR family transcriptional regulator [Geminicoccaceae bacterium 1502E]